MKYAVIQTGGKQYRVAEGDVIEVERITSNGSKSVTFSDVLLYVSDGDIKVGMPHVPGMTVAAELVSDVRGPKIRVSKFKAKARYRRTTGHRQALTQIKITQIGSEKTLREASGQAEKSTAAPKTPAKTEKNEATAAVSKKKILRSDSGQAVTKKK